MQVQEIQWHVEKLRIFQMLRILQGTCNSRIQWQEFAQSAPQFHQEYDSDSPKIVKSGNKNGNDQLLRKLLIRKEGKEKRVYPTQQTLPRDPNFK